MNGLNTRAANSVDSFAKTLDRWQAMLDGQGRMNNGDRPQSLRQLVECVIRESGLEDAYREDRSDPDNERAANLGELVSSAQEFELEYNEEHDAQEDESLRAKLDAFLEQISLIADVDGVDQSQGAVTLMTLHAAKGLEFPVVAMVALEDGLLPHERSSKTDGELEEERRLAFVGITRAKRRLLLTHAKMRTIFGQTLPTIASRFLNELPREHIELNEAESSEDDWLSGGFGEADRMRRDAQGKAGEFPPGCLVHHPSFGEGKVMSVTHSGAQTRAKVDFRFAGVRTLILQYASLTRID